MSAETNSNRKFEEALQLLNEAAREKKEEIQGLLGDKYEHIKDAIQEITTDQRKNLRRVRRLAEDALEEGGEKIREAASELDEELRENPWPYIGGVALGALVLGFLLGSSRK